MIGRALRRADRIITVSYNSKRDLVDYFGIRPARIDVIYNGVAARFRADVPRDERERVAAKYGLSRPYLLFLGGREAAQERAQRAARRSRRRAASARCRTLWSSPAPCPRTSAASRP